MNKIIISISLLVFSGCASVSLSHLHLNGNGTYIYNGLPVDGNIQIDAWSCIGISSCPAINIEEMTNASNK